MNLSQTLLLDIAKIVDACCNTCIYTDLSDREILQAIADHPYCWKLVEDNFNKNMIASKKNEILNALELKFDIQFTAILRKLLLDNSFCTFEELESAIDLVKF